uniref:Uncharacterized protein n=1 Tax=viral metagenome TaxID=1070528 RepID=A0A6C0ACP6_9ZZZZ
MFKFIRNTIGNSVKYSSYTNIKKSVIQKEVNKLNLLDKKLNLFYFYGIHLNGKICGKPGFTTCHLDNRIYSYLEKEHMYQSKDYDSFRLIFAIEFENKEITELAENFIISGLKKFPLHKNQPDKVEQFCLNKSWSVIRDSIINEDFLFGKVYFKDPDEDVNYVLNKPIKYPPKDYISRKGNIIKN